MEALQTHGKYKETWHPPTSDRFTVYERSDESWLRPLGYGSVKKTLLPLYDVRLRSNGELLGYFSRNPVEVRGGQIMFPVLQESSRVFDLHQTEPRQDTIVDTIQLRVSTFAFDRQMYLAWSVDDLNVPTLLRANILTHGPDNKEQFLYELRRRIEEAKFFANRY